MTFICVLKDDRLQPYLRNINLMLGLELATIDEIQRVFRFTEVFFNLLNISNKICFILIFRQPLNCEKYIYVMQYKGLINKRTTK